MMPRMEQLCRMDRKESARVSCARGAISCRLNRRARHGSSAVEENSPSMPCASIGSVQSESRRLICSDCASAFGVSRSNGCAHTTRIGAWLTLLRIAAPSSSSAYLEATKSGNVRSKRIRSELLRSRELLSFDADKL